MFEFGKSATKDSAVQSLNFPFFPPPIGAEPGRAKAPIGGGKKGEYRDWTRDGDVRIVGEHFCAGNIEAIRKIIYIY